MITPIKNTNYRAYTTPRSTNAKNRDLYLESLIDSKIYTSSLAPTSPGLESPVIKQTKKTKTHPTVQNILRQQQSEVTEPTAAPYIRSRAQQTKIDVARSIRRNKQFSHKNNYKAKSNYAEPQMFGNLFFPQEAARASAAFSEVAEGLDVDEINAFIKNLNESGAVKPEFIDCIKKGVYTVEQAKSFSESIKGCLPGNGNISYNLISIVIAIWILQSIKKNKANVCYDGSQDRMLYAALCANVLLLSVNNFSLLSQLIPFLKDIWDGLLTKDDAKPQSVFGFDFGKPISLLLGAYITVTTGKNIPVDLFRNLGSANKVGDTIDSVIKFVIKAFELAYNFIAQTLFGKDKYLRFLSNADPQFNLIMDRVDEIESLIKKEVFNPTLENMSKLTAVVNRISEFLRDLPRTPENANICTELVQLRNRYQKVLDLNVATGYNDGNQRIEPVTVMFKGVPGTHKTLIMNLMSVDLAKSVSDEITQKELRLNPKNYIFYRRTGEKYWDSYNPSMIVAAIDDFGQCTDVAGAETSEYLDLIRIVNTAPYPLRMGEVTTKGKVFFNSKFLLMTTNLHKIAPVSVYSADAVKRRVHFLVNVTPRPEYAAPDGSFDVEKLPVDTVENGTEVTDVNPEMALYDIVDWNGQVLRNRLSYQEFRQEVIDLYKLHEARYQMLCKNMQNLMAPPSEDLLMEPVPQGSFGRFSFRNPSGVEYDSSGPKLEDIYNEEELHVSSLLIESFSNVTRFDLVVRHLSKLIGGRPSYPLRFQICYLIRLYGAAFMDIFNDNATFDENSLTWFMFQVREGNLLPLPLELEPTELPSTIRQLWNSAMETIEQIKETILGRLTATITYMRENKIIFIGLSVLVVSPLIYKFLINTFGGLFKTLIGVDIAEPNSEVKQVPKAKIDRNSNNIRTRASKEAVPQIGCDANGSDILTSILNNNAYDMFIEEPSVPERHIGFSLAIKSTMFLMPWHFITHLDAEAQEQPRVLDCKILFKRLCKVKPITFSVTVRDLLTNHKQSPLESNDLVLVNMPRTFNMHRDITGYFLPDELISRLRNNVDVSISFPKFGDRCTTYTTAIFIDKKEVRDIDGSTYTLRQSFQYNNVDTGKGDCGAIVSYMNPCIAKTKIFGIHVAGHTSSRTGWCSVVSKEDLDTALKFFDYEEYEEPLADPQDDIYFSDGQFNPMGKVERTPRIPDRTEWTRSQMYGTYDDIFTPNEAPAPIERLRARGVTQQMYSKYYVSRIENDDFRQEVQDELAWLKDNSSVCVEPRLYTFEEAVRGIPNTSFKSVDRSTSSGYPYNLRPKSSKKNYFFGNGQDFDLENEKCDMIRKEVAHYVKCCSEKKRVPQIYSSFPKDELRPIEKVAANSIRLISGCTLTFLLAIRMYFGAFMTWITENNVNNGTTIGTNAYGADWHLLAQKLLQFNNKVNAGDYSGFDGSLTPALMWAILDLINLWYADNNSHIRVMMWREITNSWHIFEYHIFEWNGSMPSGNPLTTIINCLVNKIALRRCWFALKIPGEFSTDCYLCVMGDDNIFTVAKRLQSLFNEYTVIEPLKALGLKYTTETKEILDEYVPRDISEVEFLKRRFIFNDVLKRYVAPLRTAKALEMPYWTKKYDEQTTKDKVGIALVEIALAGKDFHEKYNTRILAEFEKTYGNRYGWFKRTDYAGLIATSDLN